MTKKHRNEIATLIAWDIQHWFLNSEHWQISFREWWSPPGQIQRVRAVLPMSQWDNAERIARSAWPLAMESLVGLNVSHDLTRWARSQLRMRG